MNDVLAVASVEVFSSAIELDCLELGSAKWVYGDLYLASLHTGYCRRFTTSAAESGWGQAIRSGRPRL